MKAIFLQHYYTASRKIGDYGILGKSEAISKEETNELLKYIDYSAPIGLPYKPTEEEMSLFPITYAYFILKSGRKCYTQSTYTGRGNHTPNRWENFFSHTLIPIGDKKIDSISVFGSKKFITKMSPEEDIQVPDNLLPLEIEIEENTSKYFEELTNFLNQGNRLLMFQSLLNAVIANFKKEPTKKILILDKKDNLPNWFFAVHFFFPYSISEKISFSSYKKDVSSFNFFLIGIVPECEHIYNNESDFCFFDMKNEKHFTDFSPTLYTKRIEEIIKEKDYPKLEEMYQMAEAFEVKEINKLDTILQYDNFIQPDKIGNLSPQEFINFANKITSNKYKEKLFNKAASYNSKLVHEFAKEKIQQCNSPRTFSSDFQEIYKNYYIKYLEKDSSFAKYVEEYVKFCISHHKGGEKKISDNILLLLENKTIAPDYITPILITELCSNAAELLNIDSISEGKLIYNRIKGILKQKDLSISSTNMDKYEWISNIENTSNTKEEKLSIFCKFLSEKNNIEKLPQKTILKLLKQIANEYQDDWSTFPWKGVIEALSYNLTESDFSDCLYDFVSKYKHQTVKDTYILQTLVCGLLQVYKPTASSRPEEMLIKKILSNPDYRKNISDEFQSGMLKGYVHDELRLVKYSEWYEESGSGLEEFKKKTKERFLSIFQTDKEPKKSEKKKASNQKILIWNRENWIKHINANKYKEIPKILSEYKETETSPSKEWIIKMLVTVLVDKIGEENSQTLLINILDIKEYRDFLREDFFNVVLSSIVQNEKKLYEYTELYNDSKRWFETRLDIKSESNKR